MENMAAFGLSGYEKSYPSALSGGMRQRAAFLRTALCKSDILLLDEPFGALDVITRGEMQDWLLSMRRKMNRTVVLVTHDIGRGHLSLGPDPDLGRASVQGGEPADPAGAPGGEEPRLALRPGGSAQEDPQGDYGGGE